MNNYIGLYYPFIHFKDDTWLKLTALYWDKMGRIVPPTYQTRDSDTVRQLAEQGGFVENVYAAFASTPYKSNLDEAFAQLLQDHGSELRSRYGVAQRHHWPDDPQAWVAAPSGMDPKLAYVYAEKMPPSLVESFVDSGLALIDRLSLPHYNRVGMHPDLAFVYMTALAEEMATTRGYHPVTDETRDHLAVSGCTLERLAHILLRDAHLVRPKSTEEEVEAKMATVAFESVLPRDIANVPAEKMIAFRNRYSDQRSAFQSHLQGMVSGLQEVQDQEALQQHLHLTYEKQLQPQLEEFKEGLHSLGIDTVIGAFNVRTIIPPLFTSGMEAAGLSMPIDPVIAAGGAMALGVVPVLRDKRKEARELASSAAPAAYLMYVEEGLGPTTLRERIARGVRQIFFDV